ncbi:hypothetical protein TcCL_Unassigned02171 [Trypanosoma cruzi]|nr:hypothetical protein TcCL_Unassigned02171 [Trypanosoma cruzi]
MKVHARRTNSETPIVAEGLTCGSCDSSTVSPTSASRAVHYRKCQAYQRAKNGQRTSASSNDSRSPSATPLLQASPAAEPSTIHGKACRTRCGNASSSTTEYLTIWENTSRTTAPFKKEKLATSLRTARRPLTSSGSKV